MTARKALGHLGCLALAWVAPGLVLGAAPPDAAAARASAEKLVTRYSPIVAFRRQEEPCGSGEAYRPTSVNLVLGNPAVELRDPSGGLVTKAPSAADLWGLGENYYLDLPGDPLHPGCDYEEDFRRWSAGTKPSVYAHVATDPGHPEKLAVQYWLYYTFNDFTDKHESDWEMIQSTSMCRQRGGRWIAIPTRSTRLSTRAASAPTGPIRSSRSGGHIR